MSMNYYIEVLTWNKAKTDADTLFKKWGYRNLSPKSKNGGAVSRFVTKLIGVSRILTRVHRGDTLVLQYPMKKFYYIACTFAHWKGAKVKTLVHDLGAFRRHKLTPEEENKRLSKTDVLIVHNETMEKWVLDHGFKGRTVCLHIFDYLVNTEPHKYDSPHKPWRIVYAGGLQRWRNEYLYKLDGVMKGWMLELYGIGYEGDINNPDINYHGNLPEDELMEKVEGDFGIVWDGGSIDECSGAWGQYLKINAPHKISFYLHAGIPVIVWKESAMRPFIENNHLGFSIGSLRELNDKLSAITLDEYKTMRSNAARVGKLIGEGHFEEQAFNA